MFSAMIRMFFENLRNRAGFSLVFCRWDFAAKCNVSLCLHWNELSGERYGEPDGFVCRATESRRQLFTKWKHSLGNRKCRKSQVTVVVQPSRGIIVFPPLLSKKSKECFFFLFANCQYATKPRKIFLHVAALGGALVKIVQGSVQVNGNQCVVYLYMPRTLSVSELEIFRPQSIVMLTIMVLANETLCAVNPQCCHHLTNNFFFFYNIRAAIYFRAVS